MTSPYLANYTEEIRKTNHSCDLIYWNRKGITESMEGIDNFFVYNRELDDGDNKLAKLPAMIGYRNFVTRIIKTEKYDVLIVLTSLLAVLLSNFVLKKYKQKYIFDIRDYSYEHFKSYKNIMKRLLSGSCLNVISSPGFLKFLPDCDCVVCHNTSFKSVGEFEFKKTQSQINIAFIGVIRYADECEKFLYNIKNDDRITFSFYGEGMDEKRIKEFCLRNEIRNVKFYGRYDPSQKMKIYNESDIIYNGYGNDSSSVKYALSNKFYDCLYFKKPIIVNANTIIEEYTKDISFVIPEKGFGADDLVKWYVNIQPGIFNRICNDKLIKIIDENNKFSNRLLSTINNLKNE